jgi:hypothetical protein
MQEKDRFNQRLISGGESGELILHSYRCIITYRDRGANTNPIPSPSPLEGKVDCEAIGKGSTECAPMNNSL